MQQRDRNLYLRATIIAAIRSFFSSRHFLEVDTPHLIPANAPEEYIDPQKSGDSYLHTSPEICMKRLLCRGHERIFQICRCWRRDERGSRHVPEFAMLEWYRRDSDYHQLMEDCQELLCWIAAACGKVDGLDYQGLRLEPCREAERIRVRDAYVRFADRDMATAVREGSFDELMVTRIEPALPPQIPVMLMDYPAEMAALARLKPGDGAVAERFELYLGGLELANGFSELNDPHEQRERFLEANVVRVKAGLSPLPLPEAFLRELALLPPSAGIALGIDRLVMLFADAARIDEVISFTPEEL